MRRSHKSEGFKQLSQCKRTAMAREALWHARIEQWGVPPACSRLSTWIGVALQPRSASFS